MAIPSIPDPYKALGLTPDASPAAIRSAYKKLMLQCHPDKVHDKSLQEEKAQQYQKVQEAYELLSDPKKKRKYD
ncbi:DnaJ domain-containing protein, partial [Kalaharituber pfeilii]